MQYIPKQASPVIEGTYTPTLGSIITGDYVGATGLDIEYARYSRVGNKVSLAVAFKVLGVTTVKDLTNPSTITLQGLPIPGLNLSTNPVDQTAAGNVFRSIGAARNTLLSGYVAVNTMYLFTFALPTNNAQNTDTHYAECTYEVAP